MGPGVGSFVLFFLTGLRLSHGAQHYSLGLPKVVQDLVLFTLSVLMGASMVPTCHLPVLAARLDAVAPGFTRKQVLGSHQSKILDKIGIPMVSSFFASVGN